MDQFIPSPPKQKPQQEPTSSEAIIIVKDLVKNFSDFEAVKGVSFGVKKGELFGFLGPNGAGKTTTIKILTTLLQPTSGQIEVAGFNVTFQKDQVRRAIGMVFQEPSLDDKLNAKENLQFHGWLYDMDNGQLKKRIPELLDLVELSDRAEDLVEQYSGGMKRRLEIARGLLHQPQVLFLDEPTLGLDPHTRNKVWEYLLPLRQKAGITIFLTTHYMDEAENCDRVAIIDHGKIIAQGTPEQLKQMTKQKSLNDVFLNLTGRDIRQ